MSHAQITITAAQMDDIPRIVDIHLRAFDGFFLTSLGEGFLRLYYDSVRTHDDGILFTCKREGAVIGFCAATVKSAGFNTSLVKSRLVDYALMAMKLIFTRPKAVLRLVRNFTKESDDMGDNGDYAELLSIGVDPLVQRSGGGRLLLQKLEEEVKRRGGEKLSLTTDYDDNEKAVGFYHALGYEVWYDFVTYPQRRMYRLIKKI